MKTRSLYRIATIVWMAVRSFVRVMWFQRKHKQLWTAETDRQWADLLKVLANEYKETALRLEGLLIKVGQFLSARADVMPKAFIDELSDLVDRVPAVPWEQARELLQREWACEYGQILQKISADPVASASIGEVYEGYLHNGDRVAVKIQRPGIEQIFRADFRAVRIVIWLAKTFTSLKRKADLPALYRELVAVTMDELNFRQELQNGNYFQERYRDDPGVCIPRYYEEHSTRRVLVMEWIEGAKVTDESFLDKHGIDRHLLAERLFKCFTGQLLFEGKFHADPHPGNLLVRPDGTLVMIDFGMVGSIRREDAGHIRSLIEGIVLQNYGQVIDSLEKLRFLLPHADKKELERVLRLAINFYNEHDMSRVEYDLVQHIMVDIETVVRNQPIQMPSEFAFLGRAVSIFIGVLHSIDPTFDMKEAGKPLIKEWLAGNGGGDGKSGAGSWLGRIGKVGLDYLRPLLQLPRLIEQKAEQPEREREWQAQKQRNELLHRYYEGSRRYAFLALLLTLAAAGAGVWLEEQRLVIGGGAAAVISLAAFVASGIKHLRFLRTLGRDDR